jgi:hypothetical protein
MDCSFDGHETDSSCAIFSLLTIAYMLQLSISDVLIITIGLLSEL